MPAWKTIKFTTIGSLNLPHSIKEELGLTPGSIIHVTMEGDSVVLAKQIPPDGQRRVPDKIPQFPTVRPELQPENVHFHVEPRIDLPCFVVTVDRGLRLSLLSGDNDMPATEVFPWLRSGTVLKATYAVTADTAEHCGVFICPSNAVNALRGNDDVSSYLRWKCDISTEKNRIREELRAALDIEIQKVKQTMDAMYGLYCYMMHNGCQESRTIAGSSHFEFIRNAYARVVTPPIASAVRKELEAGGDTPVENELEAAYRNDMTPKY